MTEESKIEVNDGNRVVMTITADGELIIADHVTPREVAQALMEAWRGLMAEQAIISGGEQ
jgi:hypothetical protein